MFNPAAAIAHITCLTEAQQQAVVAVYNTATVATMEVDQDDLAAILGEDFDLFESVCVALKWA